MKKVLLLFWLLPTSLLAQNSVNKNPGQDFFIKIINWPASAQVDGFDVVQLAKGASAAEVIIQTMPPTQFQTSGLKAPQFGGMYYYSVRSFKSSGGQKFTSANSNEVSMTVVILPTPESEIH